MAHLVFDVTAVKRIFFSTAAGVTVILTAISRVTIVSVIPVVVIMPSTVSTVIAVRAIGPPNRGIKSGIPPPVPG